MSKHAAGKISGHRLKHSENVGYGFVDDVYEGTKRIAGKVKAGYDHLKEKHYVKTYLDN